MTRTLLVLVLAFGSTAAGCASNGEETPAESSDSSSGDQTFQAALRQAESGDVEGAIRTMSGGVRAHPDHVRMRFELGRLQFETGEAFHVRERTALRDAAVFDEQGKREEATANRRAANEQRSKATPQYQAARENLRIVSTDEDDDHRAGWAYYLLARIDVFFADWEQALADLDKAIELGQPTGPLLAQWREYQQGVRDQVERAKRRW